MVRLLLSDYRVHADSKDKIGRTPLSFAAQNGYEEVVRLLLNNPRVGARSKDILGRTPLLFAITENRSEVVRLLTTNTRGNPIPDAALHNDQLLAFTAADGDDESVSAILAKEAVNLNCENCDKRTPLSPAAENGY